MNSPDTSPEGALKLGLTDLAAAIGHLTGGQQVYLLAFAIGIIAKQCSPSGALQTLALAAQGIEIGRR